MVYISELECTPLTYFNPRGTGIPVETILSKTVGIIDIKKNKKTHLKSKYCKRSPLSTPNSKDE